MDNSSSSSSSSSSSVSSSSSSSHPPPPPPLLHGGQSAHPLEVFTREEHIFNMEFGGIDTHMVIGEGAAWERTLLLAYFIPVMLIGTFGNCWLIHSVWRILSRHWFPVNLLFRQISLYILILSIVDLTVVLSIPMLLSYMLSGNWRFGNIGCKMFFAVENVNKLLSIMLLATMSVERFVAICRPLQWHGIRFSQRRLTNAVGLLACLFITVAILCAPMIHYARAHHIMYVFPDGSSEIGESACGSKIPDRLMSLFIAYMLLFGFLVPLPLIAFCYVSIIKHIQRKPPGFVSANSTRAFRSILRVVIFHFLCWTPFWVFTMLPLFTSHYGSSDTLDLTRTKNVRMVTSFLPYLNSALNWVFYGMMNRQLRESSSSLLTGRHSSMPLSSMRHSISFSSSFKRRSTRSLIASSRL